MTVDAAAALQLLVADLDRTRAEGGVDAVPAAPPIDYGDYWMLTYQSRRFVETGDKGARLAGNGPLVVPKDGRPPFWLPTTRSPRAQMEEILAADAAKAADHPEADA